MIFLEEEFRAFCPTGEGGGVKNDCSANEGGPRVDNSWKREQEKVLVSGKDLKKSPPAKSLAGVKSVTIMDGELVSKSLREVGVTLDQAAKACAALDPESDVVIAHGGMREIIEYMGSEDPDRYIEDTVTFVSTMPVAGIEGAAKTAASLTRFEGGELVMSYTMLMISDEAKAKASVAVARHMMKGTIASITQAEKIGVTSVEMLAAGDNRDSSDFKGYRIWPRLGFNGVIPRKQITPTWSLARGFFNSYGSGIPDKILSPRARKEKAAGALTIQSLYETKEGQEWWEKNGGEMEMSLNVGDAKDPGWKRFTSLRDRFSKRGLDLADAFFDVEARALLDDDWVEYRNGGCEKVEGGRFAPGNDCASDGSGGSSSKTDDSWKESNDSVSLSGSDLKEKPPFAGAEKAGRVEIANPKALLEGMAQAGVKSLDDLAAMGGATVRGSEVVFSGAGHPEMGAYLSVENKIPVSRSGDGSEGYFHVGVSVYKEGREHVLGLNEMFPTQEVKATRERVAKATSLMQQAVIESIMAADNSGIARVTMSAAGGPEYDLKGYRLWPQFGFDAPLEPSHKHALAKAPPDVIEKVMRVARPDLFATRIKPSAGALAAALPQSNINVQHLVSFHEGDLWWDNNGSTLGMVLDLSDKKSLGYAKFQKRVSQLKKLRERNQERSFFQWLDEEAEFRAGADCGRVEGGRFGSGNDCASEDGADSLPADDDGGLEMDSEAVSASPPFKGAEVLDSFSVNDVHSLKGLLGDLGKVKTVENVVAISGGARQGGSISIDSYSESIIVNSSIPVSPDGSDQLGSIKNMVSLMKDDDGNLVVAYDSMSLDSKAMSSIDGEASGDSADRRRIVSLVLERMTESMSVAEKSGAVRADTIAAGNSGSALQGYRLWPQFGFDGLLDRADVDAIKADVKLTPEQRRRANSGSMTVQQLIATPEGDRWWNENGTTIELSFDFTNKESVGYKRFERMKKMLERLKERNKNRSEFVDGVEYRKDDCGRVDGGKFGPKNDCASEDGGGDGDKKEPKAGKKKDSDDIPLGNVRRQETLLRGGKSVVVIDAEAKARAKADLERNPKPAGSHPGSSADLYGREIVSRDDPRRPNKITRLDPVFAESDLAQNGTYVSHDAVGRLLSSRHEDARKELGGEGPAAVFDTRDDLPQEQFEYVVAALKEDVDRAYEEGRNPGFYSTDIAECMDIMSGFYPELKDPDEAKRRGTTPEDAAFVFTMITAITSNGTDPALNLESADRIYRLYREHGSVRTPDQVMGGERATEIRKSLNRFQAMIDEFGESRTRSLLSGVTRASTIASTMKRLAAKSQEIGGSWSEKDLKGVELGDEVVPVAAIFGPKIGSFFANLSGKHQFLTMDRWLMRSVGRVTGELLSRATPNAANKQANAAIRAIKQRARSRDILFGVDKPPLSLKREDVIRSLELQARTGIIEESSAAFEWAKAAERSFNKVPRGVSKSGEPSGSYGTHPDPQIDAAHRAGNTIFKSLIHEQQDPRSARARHVLRGVFREVAKRVAAENPSRLGEVQVSEIQAVLWQYEQNLWKRLGAKTKIEGDSLYSAAAKSLKQRRDSGEEPVALKPEKARRPKSVRSYDATRQDNAATDGETDFPNQSGQDLWDNETELAGVDFVELLKAISSEIESRAFCPTGEGGGVDNSCGSDDGSSSSSRSPESMPRSFPRGSEKFRDAIDSVSPNPKAVWDRSRGRADTPPEKVITAAADEQGSSGASLTPEAEASYKDLIDEIGRQYEALTAAGLKAKAWRGEGEPYGDPPGSTKPNSDKMREEVAKTGEFSFFMTEKGFGTGSATPDHPMLRETKYKTADGEPMIANDLFRVVHDMVAHVRGGYSFSTNGEYNGMLTHASTLPESAWPALFAETFGQNAVYEKTGNYAPQNAYASKVGPEIIKAELAKRNRKVRRAIDAEYESDEPLGYQHLKVRPWLMKGATESRAYCPTGDGGGIDNSCSASDKGKEPIPAGDKSLKSYEPFTPNESTRNSDFAILPSDEEASAALKEPQREKYGAHRTLPAGYPLDLRIDIPAFENHGAYVVTAHEHVNGAGVGAPVGYDSIIRLKGDVDFRVGETAATKIARGKTSKNTHSTVKGKFDPSRDIPEDIDDWTPVGYNPKTATYYYDKRNGKEIVGGVDSISVGNSVFVRIPKYGNGRDPSKPPRNAKTDYRSADCGRDESGKFGSGNDCAADEGGSAATATAAPSGDRWSSNETMVWPVSSRDTSPPPVGDGRYGSINVSAPKAVKASLDAAGIDPELAPMVAGGSEDSDVFVRPAPDFSMEFPDSKVTPVMFAFERDFAGIESGLHGSSVIGVTASGETVVYHSTVNVADSIKSDDSKRHAAAREFYRAMTSSVEAARKAGVSRIVLNAAGNSSATKGSVTSTPWRGYTIWPRMGFDAPLPASIKAKLPPDLSHAKSLLDLHATPEGTRWWRDNGEDLDVSFDLKDRSSPQAKIMDRFIKKFGESRREMPLGSGDEWMSPEDLVRLDEMWQEIWDDGELDDYEWVESRSADCGRDEGGRFDQGNQCQRGAGKVAALAKSGASHEELTAAIAEAIGTKRGWFTGPEAGESSPSEVCEALGLNVANDWIVDKYHAESTQYTREAIAKTIAEVYAAVQAVPSLKDVEFHIQTAQSIAKHTGTSQFRWEGVQGAYLPVDNEIHILAGTTDSQITPEFLHKSGYSSTPSPAHTLVHEDVHREHYENAAAKTGSPRPPKHATEEQVYRWATGLKMDIMRNLEVAAMRDPAWIYRCESKVEKLGFYATTDPLEFVAEYATAVKLGYAKNDPDLDKMCKAMLAPVPRKAKA